MDMALYIESEREVKIFILARVGELSKKQVTLLLEKENWNFKRVTTALYLEKYKVYIHWKLFLIDHDKQIKDGVCFVVCIN